MPKSRRSKQPASTRSQRSGADHIAITYRRRDINTGYKAGNIRRLLRAVGRRSRIRRDARRRQFHDRRRNLASGAHHASRSQARHSARPRRRPAVDQRLRAHLPVRHAARHALLHHRQRLVARRLRPLLGPQRGAAAGALHRALRASGVQERIGRRPHSQPRPDRGRADAPRRLRRARAAGRRTGLGGKPTDADRIHPPRSALVPGQYAILAFPFPSRPQARQPLSACDRDPDVHRVAGLDRHARPRHAVGWPPPRRPAISFARMPAWSCSCSSW